MTGHDMILYLVGVFTGMAAANIVRNKWLWWAIYQTIAIALMIWWKLQ